ncbi:putative SWEET sugar transporter [Rosa chinensis]|uniref:Putative SWEET sugar transporter n=1 Tax=Rosa chinensis TaxID=74649 RepID=A0A2P6P4R0_ROSCH|nr:putative SWEET sugar transporter [Rosa chinensis]
MAIHQPLTLAFGLLGNIISFMVFLDPMPTFYTIYKKKQRKGFKHCHMWWHSSAACCGFTMRCSNRTPHCSSLSTLLAASLRLPTLLFSFFMPPRWPGYISTLKLLLLLNVFGYGLMTVLTLFRTKGEKRLKVVGWICLVFNQTVFAAPLCISVST